MKNFTLSVLGFLTFLSSCNNDDTNPPTPTSQSTELMPLAIGKQWKYRTKITQILHGDTTIIARKLKWLVAQDTLINNVLTYVIAKEELNEASGQILHRNEYYQIRPDGFYAVASNQGDGQYHPHLRLSLGNQALFSTSGLSLQSGQKINNLYFPAKPVQYLKSPVNQNEVWQSYEVDSMFNIERKYTGLESVSVPAGTYSAQKVTRIFHTSFQGDHIVDQHFVAGKGFVREEYNLILSNCPTCNDGSVNSVIELEETNF